MQVYQQITLLLTFGVNFCSLGTSVKELLMNRVTLMYFKLEFNTLAIYICKNKHGRISSCFI